MTVRRIVPDVETGDVKASRAFYVDVFGLEVVMDMGFIVTLASPSNETAQLSLVSEEPSAIVPRMTIEVGDVDAAHSRAVSRGCEIVYPLTDEPWHVRRFFVKDPSGIIVNVMSHVGSSK